MQIVHKHFGREISTRRHAFASSTLAPASGHSTRARVGPGSRLGTIGYIPDSSLSAGHAPGGAAATDVPESRPRGRISGQSFGHCRLHAHERQRPPCRLQRHRRQYGVVNLTWHSYFNLQGRGDILGHFVQIKCRSLYSGEQPLSSRQASCHQSWGRRSTSTGSPPSARASTTPTSSCDSAKGTITIGSSMNQWDRSASMLRFTSRSSDVCSRYGLISQDWSSIPGTSSMARSLIRAAGLHPAQCFLRGTSALSRFSQLSWLSVHSPRAWANAPQRDFVPVHCEVITRQAKATVYPD